MRGDLILIINDLLDFKCLTCSAASSSASQSVSGEGIQKPSKKHFKKNKKEKLRRVFGYLDQV